MDANYTNADVARFWAKVDRSGGEDSCWIWKACTYRTGYGAINWNRISTKAHRISYLLANGAYSDELCVLHSCDNPLCVNPKHLFLGTRKDNAQDMVGKMRHLYGDRATHRKLSQTEADEIRMIYARGGLSQEKVGALFGVCQQSVSHIVRRNTWNLLPPEGV